MREGRALTNGDDARKRGAPAPTAADVHLQGIGKVLFAICRPEQGAEGSEGSLGDVDRLADLLNLGGVFHGPELFHALTARLPGDRRRQFTQRLPFSDRELAALDADRTK